MTRFTSSRPGPAPRRRSGSRKTDPRSSAAESPRRPRPAAPTNSVTGRESVCWPCLSRMTRRLRLAPADQLHDPRPRRSCSPWQRRSPPGAADSGLLRLRLLLSGGIGPPPPSTCPAAPASTARPADRRSTPPAPPWPRYRCTLSSPAGFQVFSIWSIWDTLLVFVPLAYHRQMKRSFRKDERKIKKLRVFPMISQPEELRNGAGRPVLCRFLVLSGR